MRATRGIRSPHRIKIDREQPHKSTFRRLTHPQCHEEMPGSSANRKIGSCNHTLRSAHAILAGPAPIMHVSRHSQSPQIAAALRSLSRRAAERIPHDCRVSVRWPRCSVLHLDVLVEVVAAFGGAVFPSPFTEADGERFLRVGFPTAD